MKHISIVLILFLTSACISPQKKGKVSWQEDKSTQKRTLASVRNSLAEETTSGYFIRLDGFSFRARGAGITDYMNQYCDSRKSFVYVENRETVICVKK